MEFATKEELYQKLLPVFEVKKRLLSITKYQSITNIDIWNYLIKKKWLNSHNLMLQEIVNDIITVEPEKVLNIMEEYNEKEKNI